MSGNRVAWSVLGGLILVMLIAGIAYPKKKPPSPIPPPPPADARGIVLTADHTARTIVVPACGSTSAASAGAVRFEVSGTRTILIPDCQGTVATGSDTGHRPSVLVLPEGATKLIDRQLQVGVRSQVLVPAGSTARTLVVPACVAGRATKAKHQDVILSKSSGTTATAPAC
ncbi:MAG TPA: hypothetical protein VGI54_07740 [Solirubrobacteraceae bacterium]